MMPNFPKISDLPPSGNKKAFHAQPDLLYTKRLWLNLIFEIFVFAKIEILVYYYYYYLEIETTKGWFDFFVKCQKVGFVSVENNRFLEKWNNASPI